MTDYSKMSIETMCILSFGSPFDNEKEQEEIQKEYSEGGILAMFAKLAGQSDSSAQ